MEAVADHLSDLHTFDVVETEARLESLSTCNRVSFICLRLLDIILDNTHKPFAEASDDGNTGMLGRKIRTSFHGFSLSCERAWPTAGKP